MAGTAARAGAVVLAALTLAACATHGGSFIASAPPPDPKTQLPALERRVFELSEQAREATDPKARPLILDSELSEVARAHSQDMARQHFLGHRAPDGETAASIIMARDANFQGLLGENLAAQYYTKAGGLDPGAYAKRFIASWMDSKSHRENLAFPDYERTGVGAAIDGNTVYVTQLFSAPPSKAAAEAAQSGGGEKTDGSDTRQVKAYSDPKAAKKDKPFQKPAPMRGSMGHDSMGHDSAAGSAPDAQ